MSQKTDISKDLSSLSLSDKPRPEKTRKPKVAESWDDSDSDSQPEQEPETSLPTPITPSNTHSRNSSSSVSSVAASPPGREPTREGSSASGERGVKTDAVARRMISAALGIRTKSTKEQREYDASVRRKEQKKKDEERERKRLKEVEKEKLKTAVWED